jgi:hypothetical protein
MRCIVSKLSRHFGTPPGPPVMTVDRPAMLHKHLTCCGDLLVDSETIGQVGVVDTSDRDTVLVAVRNLEGTFGEDRGLANGELTPFVLLVSHVFKCRRSHCQDIPCLRPS